MQSSAHGRTDRASVIVPGITAPSTVACLRSLSPRGIYTIVGSEDRTTPASVSTYCDRFITLPNPRSDLETYGQTLLSLAARPSVETIIPVREEDIYVLAANKEEFADVIGTPWPDFETLRSVQDRVELFTAADRAGVGTPETTLLDEWDDWTREAIIKPRYTVAAPEYLGQDSDLSDIGSTVYHEPGTPPAVESAMNEWGHVPIVQEYVPDTSEYGFFALYDEGEPVATFQHCQKRGYKYSGGPSSYRESTDIPELEEAGLALLDELEWHGLAMVEFLRDPETGEFKLMEINPRFWSSLPFSVRAGVDFPLHYWQLATGKPVTADGEYEVGIGGHLIRGELCYIHSIVADDFPLVDRPALPAACREIASSVVAEPRFDYAVVGDFKPFVQDSWNLVRDAVGEQLRAVFSDESSDPTQPVVPTPLAEADTDGGTPRTVVTDGEGSSGDHESFEGQHGQPR
ncbi:carboxylate--amine ligase [Natrialbaceae archaeon A-CW3]